jgi:phage shock protein E
MSLSRKHTQSKDHAPRSASHWRHKTHKRSLTWLWVGLGVFLVVVVGVLLLRSQAAQTAGTSPSSTASSVEISPAQAYAKYLQGAFFLDVRTQDEWNQFHIKGSMLIPLDELQNRLSELSKDKDIVVVCLSGHRSQSGTAILQKAGFTHVSCLSGGLQAWMDANYPVEKGTP